MSCKVKGRNNGFSLVELIIAITILSFVAVIIGNAFRLGIQAWERGEREIERTQRLRSLSSLMSQQLKSFYPYRIKMEDKDEETVMFEGEPDSFTFVTTLTDSSFGGVKWVKYIFRDGDLLYKEGLLPDKKFEEKVKDKDNEEIIDTNVENCEFSYLSTDDDEWKEKWDIGEEEMPGAIRVNISGFDPFVIKIPVSSYDDNDNEDKGPEETEDE